MLSLELVGGVNSGSGQLVSASPVAKWHVVFDQLIPASQAYCMNAFEKLC